MTQPGPASDVIFKMATATLAAVVAGWPTDPAVQPALPARQYVTIGTPAADAEQLVVAAVRTIGVSANVGQQRIIPEATDLWDNRAVILVVQVLRKVGVVQDEGMSNVVIPSPVWIQADAATILGDAQCVTNAIADAHRETGAGKLGEFGNIAFETWDAISPSGQLGGGQLRFRIGLW